MSTLFDEKLKEETMAACMNIYLSYTEEEVKKFAPAFVQKAWFAGAKVRETLRKREALKIKKGN